MKTRQQEPPGRGGGDKARGQRQSENQQSGRNKGQGHVPPGRGQKSRQSTDSRPERTDRGKERRGQAPGDRPSDAGKRRPGDGSARDGERGQGRPPRRQGRPPRAVQPAVVLARPRRDLIYGRNAVLEALRGRRDVERLFLAEGGREDERVREISRLAQARGAEIEVIPRLMLDDVTRGANHQGIALEAEAYRYVELDQLLEIPGSVLVLDHLQDPQNLGTLLRTAEAAGIAGVVMPQNRTATITPAVVNASAGAVEHVRIATVPNLAQALETLRGGGRWIVGLDTGPGATNLFTTAIPTPTVLVVGAEGPGLSPLLRKRCDLVVSLPMVGKVASLNAATAGAIGLYELLRQAEAERQVARGASA